MSSFPALNGAPGIDNFQADFNSLSARALAYLQSVLTLTPPVTLTNTNAAQIPLSIVGAAAQSANLQEWQNSAANSILEVGADPLTVPALSVMPDALGSDLLGVDIRCGGGGIGSGYGIQLRNSSVNTRARFNFSGNRLTVLAQDSGITIGTTGGSNTRDIVFTAGGNLSVAKMDGNTNAGETRLLLYDVDNGQLERVSVGAADSGGVGFKVLRIPN